MKSKKELKSEYKQQKPDAGVLQIKNNANGKMLIEAATNIQSKWNRHRTELRFGSHRNKALQNDWNKNGETSFEMIIISRLELNDDKDIDLNTELRTLMALIEDEVDIPQDLKY